MAKRKKFDELTPVEKYKKLRNTGYTFKGLKWLSILAPFITIGIINFEDYFQEANGIKMSLGCILALVVAGIAVFNETKENKKVNNIVGWVIAFALVFFFQSILEDLLMIVGFGLLGQLVGSGFEIGSAIQLEKAEIYKKAIIEAESYKEV